MFEAYTHNGDDKALRELGLRSIMATANEGWHNLGTVTVHEEEPVEQSQYAVHDRDTVPPTTVKVEVYAAPAQFWRFTVTRPQDATEDLPDKDGVKQFRVIYEPLEVFKIETGSGSFQEYWPGVKQTAEHCFEVTRVEAEA